MSVPPPQGGSQQPPPGWQGAYPGAQAPQPPPGWSGGQAPQPPWPQQQPYPPQPPRRSSAGKWLLVAVTLLVVIGVTVAGVLFWSVISGVFFRVFLRVADAAFQEYDERSNRRLSRRRTSQDRQQRSRLPKVTKAHRILSVTAATSSQMNWSP